MITPITEPREEHSACMGSLERTAAAIYFTGRQRRACAASAAQRHYVMRRNAIDIWHWIRSTGAALSITLPAAVFLLWGLSYFRVLGLSGTLRDGRGESGIWSTGGRILVDTIRHLDVSRMPGVHS